MKRNIYWILMLFLIVGCLDDKSNFDYSNINDFDGWHKTGVTNVQSSYTLYPGEVLKLEPKVRFSIDTVNLDASYAWYLGSKKSMQLLSNTLNYTFNAEKIGEYELIFSVKDNKTGVIFSKEIEMTVVSPYKNGWIVLSKGASGESQVSMILSRLQKKQRLNEEGKEESVDTVVYAGQDINITSNLGNGPLKLVENFIYPGNTSDLELQSEIMILQQSGCLELNGNNLTPVGYARDEFYGSVPANFMPKAAILSWDAKYLLNQDNLMYMAAMSVGTDLHSGRYLADPVFDGKKIKELLPLYKDDGNFLVVGIGEDNTFFGIMDDANVVDYYSDFTIDIRNYVGSYMELEDNAKVDMSLFRNINGEYVFHAWESCPYSIYQPGPTWVSILKRGGSYLWHSFRLGAQDPRYKPGQKMVIEESVSGELDPSMMTNYKCAALLPWKQLLAIASGNQLNFFDYANSKRKISVTIPGFSSAIVDMAVKDYNSDKNNAHLAIALTSGEIYVYEVKYDSIEQSIALVEVYHGEGFGEIVDLEYKFGSGAKPGTASLY